MNKPKNEQKHTVDFKCSALEDDKLSMVKFSGGVSENFIFFRREFENIMQLCEWSEEASMLQLRRSLHGQALHYYMGRTSATVQAALDDLQHHYIGTDAFELYNRKFRQSKQSEGQSVKSYYSYFNDIVHQCNALAPNRDDLISEDIQITTFMDGLNSEIQVLTTMQKPQSLSEAYEYATRAEQSLKLTANKVAETFKHKGNKRQSFIKSKQPNNGNKDSHIRRCSHCHLGNHEEAECWKLHPADQIRKGRLSIVQQLVR